jgi:hypothetical protein
MIARALMTATLAGAIAMPALAQNGQPRIFPIEERGEIASLDQAVSELLAAADARDVDGVMAFVDPQIQFSFGIDNGAAAFRQQLETSGTQDNPTDWMAELADAIRLGGVIRDYRQDIEGEQTSYCFPYFSCLSEVQMRPVSHLDPYQSAFVIRHDAAIHAGPSRETEVIGVSSYEAWSAEAYEPDRDAAPDDWLNSWAVVSLGKGGTGYIHAEDVRSWVGFRGWLLEQDDGSWSLVTFIAGD